jgi:hypothetical protein
MRNTGIVVASILLLLMLLITPTIADDSRDCAHKGRAMWSAFECSSLASKNGNAEEQGRLFLYGYNEGQQFIAAVKAKKIKKDDLSSEVPMIVLLLLEGPTPDFMLGRIFEAAQKSALEDVFKFGEHFNSEQEQLIAAKDKFWKLNCQLIGKQK